jgi:hypothetical protein
MEDEKPRRLTTQLMELPLHFRLRYHLLSDVLKHPNDEKGIAVVVPNDSAA